MLKIPILISIAITFVATYLFFKVTNRKTVVHTTNNHSTDNFVEELFNSDKPMSSGIPDVTVGMVYDYFNNNGYIKECQAGNYKFSAQRLHTLIKNKALYNLSIKENSRKITGVGYKVYSLIEHLIKKYGTVNI